MWTCRALPGDPCRTPDGRTTHPHRPRWVTAILYAADTGSAAAPAAAPGHATPAATTTTNTPAAPLGTITAT